MKTFKCVCVALAFSAMSGVALAQNDQTPQGVKKEELKGNAGNQATPTGAGVKAEDAAKGRSVDANHNAGGQTQAADHNQGKTSEEKKADRKAKGKKEAK